MAGEEAAAALIPGVGPFLAVGLSLFGISSASKSARRARQASKLEGELTGLKNKRRVNQFLRNFRAAQATAIAAGGATAGGLDSSRTQGTLTSQQTQANVEIVSAHEQSTLQKKIARKGQQASDLLLQSNLASTASSFVGSKAGQDIFGS
jgi:hypothetical protein